MKLSKAVSILTTAVVLFAAPAKASPLYLPEQYDILPDLVHAAKQPSHKSHQTHYDILEILPVEQIDKEKQHYAYDIEDQDDHSWLEAILESVFGKPKSLEKEMHVQHVHHIKEPTGHRKDYHQSHDKELDELAEILEADGVNIGVMIVS
ncbi:hypothetical protein CVT24_008231 [Panaeolus cyanescens]|uniref:Peptidase S53 activation domain-containing protein n=1 Tax=Panaeolus cyanescens TaxID=181874 RepID=A0A409YR45_9AGAR|nr:hypothetical protein CVT24_008231 [Panaeolus cyanescens]